MIRIEVNDNAHEIYNMNSSTKSKTKMLQSHFCGYNDAETFVKKIWTVFPTLPTDWQSKQITLKIDHHSLTV